MDGVPRDTDSIVTRLFPNQVIIDLDAAARAGLPIFLGEGAAIMVDVRDIRRIERQENGNSTMHGIRSGRATRVRIPIQRESRRIRRLPNQRESRRLLQRIIAESIESYKPRPRPACPKSVVEFLQKVEITEGHCTICLDDFQDEMEMEVNTIIPCSHNFHKACIIKWLEENNVCPLCRFAFSTKGSSDLECY